MRALTSLVVFMILMTPGLTQNRQEADSLLNVLNVTKPGTKRIDILLKLAQFHIFKPGENKIDFDSANNYIDEAEVLNRKVKSPACEGYRLLTKSYMLREKGEQDAAKEMTEKAVGVLNTSNNNDYLGQAYYQLSSYYNFRDSIQVLEQIRLVQQAVLAFSKAGNIEQKASAMKMLGDLYGVNREYAKTIEVLNQALAAYDSINYKNLQGVYDLLARAYKQTDDYKHALQYELLALRSAQAANDSSMNLCLINNTLGVIYREIGRKDIAIKYYRDALDIALKHDDRFGIALLVYNISVCFKDLEQPQQILDLLKTIPENLHHPSDKLERTEFAMSYLAGYTGTGQFEHAQKYSDILLGLVDSPEIPDEIRSIIYHNVAAYYVDSKNFDKARILLTKNRAVVQRLVGHRRIANDSKLWYKLDSVQGNYSSAFQHLLTYKTISDSLFSETKSRQFQQLEVEYETAKKTDSLKTKDQHISLLTQKNNLQRKTLEQSDLIKNITIAGIILALGVIALLYHQYRQKQKSNKVISNNNEQLRHLVNEKEWLLKEVHHRVKNNLQVMMSLLESQSVYLQNDALLAVEDSQRRIYAMSLLHQKLYQSGDIKSLNMSIYIREFVHYLTESFDVSNKILFRFDVDDVELSVTQAVPLALIMNEAVTNSIKYAFPGKQVGEIGISLKQWNHDDIEMEIADNGIGIAREIIDGNRSSLGIDLMMGLCEEIKGHIQFDNSKGTTITIRFKKMMFNDTGAFNVVEERAMVTA